jgi:hypothetical protein
MTAKGTTPATAAGTHAADQAAGRKKAASARVATRGRARILCKRASLAASYPAGSSTAQGCRCTERTATAKLVGDELFCSYLLRPGLDSATHSRPSTFIDISLVQTPLQSPSTMLTTAKRPRRRWDLQFHHPLIPEVAGAGEGAGLLPA